MEVKSEELPIEDPQDSEDERDLVRSLAKWLLLVPLILMVMFCSGTLAMLETSKASADTHSKLKADYRPWPFMVIRPIDPRIIEEIKEDRAQMAELINEPEPLVRPGSIWVTPTPPAGPTATATPAQTALATSTPSLTLSPTSQPSVTATVTATHTATSTSTQTMTPTPSGPPTLIKPPVPPVNTYWFYNYSIPFAYMMRPVPPNGAYRNAGSVVFYSLSFPAWQSLQAGTTTVRFYATNPSGSGVILYAELRAGGTLLGSGLFSLPSNVVNASFFNASFATSGYDFSAGDRLTLSMNISSPGSIYWDGAYDYSGVEIPPILLIPTSTPTYTATSTSTSTITRTPTITNTSLPPTATNTPLPPTATNTSTPGPTSTSTDTPTITETPVATDTQTPTDTPTETATSTETSVLTNTPVTYDITGRVFEDWNYNGGFGTPYGAGDSGLPNVRVDLYDNVGTFITFANTNAFGIYTLPNVADGNYVVRVVSATIGDVDTSPTSGFVGGFSNATAEQTYEYDGVVGNGGPGAMGGNSPLVDDTLIGVGAGEGDTNVIVTVSGADLTGIDLGFSFNLIVNTFDTGQGSLRQFMLNANAIAGINSSQFNIPNTDPNFDTLYSNGYAFQSNTPLPILTNNGTSINGATQETNQGDQRGGPDIILDGTNLGINDYGVHIQANSCSVRTIDMRQYNNGAAIGMGTAVLIDGSAGGGDSNVIQNNYLSENCSIDGLVGAITIAGDADNNNISSNTILLNNGDGILFQSILSSGTTISGNTLFANGDDGMFVTGDLHTISNNSINFNQQISVSACGIEFDTVTNSTISFNSISNNGTQGGICFTGDSSSNNTIGPNNTISGNFGPGIQIQMAASANNAITTNAIFTNLGLGIDLNNDGVTLNDLGDGDLGPNDELNFPEIYSAQVAGGFVTITGETRPFAIVEFYESDNDGSGYGEGAIYVGSGTEGTPADTSPAAGLIDPTAEQFTFILPAGSLSVGDLLTATATDDTGNTSEFSLNFVVTP